MTLKIANMKTCYLNSCVILLLLDIPYHGKKCNCLEIVENENNMFPIIFNTYPIDIYLISS